jgi:hypothetical protein
VEYCTRLNDVIGKHDATIVCTYNLGRFGAGAVIDVLRSHPVAIIGGMVHENPFYVPPDELLKELRQRQERSSRGGGNSDQKPEMRSTAKAEMESIS